MQNRADNRNVEDNGLEVAIAALGGSIARLTDNGELFTTAIPGLSLFRREVPTEPMTGMYEPSICMVAQGAKQVLLGEDEYVYDSHHYLITSVHLPTVVQIVEASRERPYLGLRLKFDLREIAQLMADSNLPAPRTQQSSRGMATGEVTPALVSAVHRLVDLLSDEQDIPILAPVIQREIIYRLLVGDQGERLRQIASAGSQSQQIARAIEWLKGNFAQPLRIDDLAAQARMSSSASSSLPVHDRPESVTVPEAAPSAGGQASYAGGAYGCCKRGISGWVRKPVPVQPRVQPYVWSPTVTGRDKAAPAVRHGIAGF